MLPFFWSWLYKYTVWRSSVKKKLTFIVFSCFMFFRIIAVCHLFELVIVVILFGWKKKPSYLYKYSCYCYTNRYYSRNCRSDILFFLRKTSNNYPPVCWNGAAKQNIHLIVIRWLHLFFFYISKTNVLFTLVNTAGPCSGDVPVDVKKKNKKKS